MADNVKKRQSSKQVAAESSPPKKTPRKSKQTVAAVLEPDSGKCIDVLLDMPSAAILPAAILPVKPLDKVTHVAKPAKAVSAPAVSGLAAADVASLLLALSSQVSSLAEEISSTRAELRSLPPGVTGPSSLAKIVAGPSATVTTADVHAVQDGDEIIPLSLGVPSPGGSLSQGMFATRVPGFSGESVARLQSKVATGIALTGESSDTPPGHRPLSGRSGGGRDTVERTDSSMLSAAPFDVGQSVRLPLPPLGEEDSGDGSLFGYGSQAGGQLPDCTGVQDDCLDDGTSVLGDDAGLRLPFRLGSAVALAAETASKYFEEGVVESKSQLAPPPSALGDFRVDKNTKGSFKFIESPSLAFEMSKVLVKGWSKGLPPVPLLAQHSEAPEAAVPWLAKVGQQVPCSANLRNFRLVVNPVRLIDSYSLPKSVLPVTPELAALREDGYAKDRPVPCTESSLMSLEETGRSLLELASVSESLQRSLSRSIATSLDPFEFRYDASSEDVTTLLATLARVSQEQMALSARLYTFAVHSRRSAFLTGSRIRDKVTIEALKVSPVMDGSLLGRASLDALQKETHEARDLAIAKIAHQGFQKPQGKPQGQGKAQSSSAAAGKTQGQSSSSRGRGRGASSQKRGSFGGSRGSGRKPHPQ
ncbi:uncharacterized protein [Littorina saxatilis]|uniref:uncharacterized protein n=1 Tax=Littorina saxatilis TaxID=31220 RepID=UPI0038B5D311